MCTDPEENVPQGSRQPRSRDQAAAAVGVSGKLVSAAKAINVARVHGVGLVAAADGALRAASCRNRQVGKEADPYLVTLEQDAQRALVALDGRGWRWSLTAHARRSLGAASVSRAA